MTSTILALAGLDPSGYGDRDLTARVVGGPDGPAAGQDKPVMFENMGAVGIHDGAFTMTWDLETGRPVELYDRSTDPDEIDEVELGQPFHEVARDLPPRAFDRLHG